VAEVKQEQEAATDVVGRAVAQGAGWVVRGRAAVTWVGRVAAETREGCGRMRWRR